MHEGVLVPTMDNNEYRRRLIARVEALRTEAGMPMLRFRQQIGPVAAKKWTRFVVASDEEAWQRFPLKYMDRIGAVFGVGGANLMQFKPD
jgi:hypothetical protein